MSQISMKLLLVGDAHGYPHGGIGHFCPGCGIMHVFSIDKADRYGRRFAWDGDSAAPTFFPDMDVWPPLAVPIPPYYPATRCHYTLVAGVIEYFACTHRHTDQRVPLPDLPGHLIDRASFLPLVRERVGLEGGNAGAHKI